jgi:hypothetical protein
VACVRACRAGIVVGPNLFVPNEVANPMVALMMSQKAVLFLTLTVEQRAVERCGGAS